MLPRIPDRISAVKGDARFWAPPIGSALHVWCDGVRLRYVIEADRAEGWVVTKRYIESGDEAVALSGTRMYRGRVTFQVVTGRARAHYHVASA